MNKPYSLFQRFKILYGIGGLNYGMGKRHQIVRTSKRASGREARDFEKRSLQGPQFLFIVM